MNYKRLLFLALAMFWSVSAYAQQQSSQPLTHWAQYAVKPGKEEEFLNLVKTVGQPVRDKLMADGVVLAWGVEVSLLRGHDPTTHAIWYSVADWSGIEKVETGLAAQVAKLDAEAAKSAEGKKGAKAGPNTMERLREVVDFEKTKDYVTRDLVFVAGQSMPPAGTLPSVRYNFVKVKPGKSEAFRAAWDKYNKPVLDKLVADGVVLAYGLSIEDVKTTGEFTHFVWYAVNSLGDLEKVRNAYRADRDRRSPEEREAISEAFLHTLDPDASRNEVDHNIIFHLPGQK
jgi:hypothetical protein